MCYIKLNTDLTSDFIYLSSDVKTFVSECYDILNCISIEIVPTFLDDIVLIINEEGKMRSDFFYHFNHIASYLFYQKCDFIVGDAIIARLDDDDIIPLYDSDVLQLIHFISDLRNYLKHKYFKN